MNLISTEREQQLQREQLQQQQKQRQQQQYDLWLKALKAEKIRLAILEQERQREEQQRQQQQQYDLWLKALKAEETRLEILEQERQREREETLKRQKKQQQEAEAAAAAVAAVVTAFQRTTRFEYRDQGQPDYGWDDYGWNSAGSHYKSPPQPEEKLSDWRGQRKSNRQNQPPSSCGRRKRGRKGRGDLYEDDYHAGHSKGEIKAMCRERNAAFQARCLKASE
ncbi:hypothetical protein BGZ51_003507 [Haplosporangium sp. Z 767]|nr:hypothetical protein BGZ51_003507 [Haplosporangium sp. Z 767]